VWKRFRADRTYGKLADQLPLLHRSTQRPSGERWRWALREVDLAVDPGESVGLIGFNGSGKSTLLKILTRVMYPHSGQIEVGGSVGALLEVVSGIHHELTGRENMFLYGSLMGLPRATVAERLDEMVAFAELEAAIDRQVKFYSLGMQMRLGFAVASFLDSDVLLVDEVLAVGDASFQQKCLEQMRTALADGTTLVLVSHDLAAVAATCTRTVWLSHGRVALDGPTSEVLPAYRRSIEQAAESLSDPSDGDDVRLLKVVVRAPDGGVPQSGSDVDIAVHLDSSIPVGAALAVGISDGPATPIMVVRRDVQLLPGQTVVHCSMERLPVPRGSYYVWITLFDGGSRALIPWHPAAQLELFGPELDAPPVAVVRLAPVYVAARWTLDRGGDAT
jgi:ABC-type polysaccharide/polyol phosphate transport system ATPase subunit